MAVILASVAAVIIKLTAKKNYKPILACSFLIVTLAGFLYLKNAVDNKNNRDWKLNNISVRANYSAEAFRIIKKFPFFGGGIGDKKYTLIERDKALGDKRYVEFGADTKPNDIFNSHNQFLDFWIDAGIIPVICLLLFFHKSILKSNPLQVHNLYRASFLFLSFLFY